MSCSDSPSVSDFALLALTHRPRIAGKAKPELTLWQLVHRHYREIEGLPEADASREADRYLVSFADKLAQYELERTA